MTTQPHIAVLSTDTTKHTSKKTGNAYYRQNALFVRGDGASYPIELMVDEGQPHKPGNYALHPRSFKPTRYGVELDPVPGALIPAAAAKAA